MPMNLDSLAALYLQGDTKRRTGWIAWLTVKNLVESDPEQAWQFILRALAHAKTDEEIAYLAAGPLEDLLKSHGQAFAGRIDEAWRRDEKMRRAMNCVWL